MPCSTKSIERCRAILADGFSLSSLTSLELFQISLSISAPKKKPQANESLANPMNALCHILSTLSSSVQKIILIFYVEWDSKNLEAIQWGKLAATLNSLLSLKHVTLDIRRPYLTWCNGNKQKDQATIREILFSGLVLLQSDIDFVFSDQCRVCSPGCSMNFRSHTC